jgi:SAM-dependent methyltransferase
MPEILKQELPKSQTSGRDEPKQESRSIKKRPVHEGKEGYRKYIESMDESGFEQVLPFSIWEFNNYDPQEIVRGKWSDQNLSKYQSDKYNLKYFIEPISWNRAFKKLNEIFEDVYSNQLSCKVTAKNFWESKSLWYKKLELYLPEMIIIDSTKSSPVLEIVEHIRVTFLNGLIKTGMLGFDDRFNPIIVVITKQSDVAQKAVEQGADLITPELNQEDLNKLLNLITRYKSEWKDLSVEDVLTEKMDFYYSVAGMPLVERAKITADTPQELKILKDIFKKYNVKKVLDVGSGNGRITNQLAQDKDITISGLELVRDLRKEAQNEAKNANLKNVKYYDESLIEYYGVQHYIKNGSQDAVIYTWHSILEAFGIGNTLKTLKGAFLKLKPGGILVFDMPTRENPGMADGWYGQGNIEEPYLAYLFTEDEIRFILKMTGFEDVEIQKWQTAPSDIYPEGMKKITVVAKKNAFVPFVL